MPEIPLFKDIQHSGYAEIKVSTTDVTTGDFVSESGPVIGKSSHDDYTILIVVHFTRSDMETPSWSLVDG